MAWQEHHKRAQKAHKLLGAIGAGDKAHAQREPGDPRHVAHHAHQGLGHVLSGVEGVMTIGEKVMWTGIKWGAASIGAIGGLTALTHSVDGLHPVENLFDLPHDAVYAGGAAVLDVSMMGRRAWIEGKSILGHFGQAIDHSETAVRSAGKVPAHARKRISSMRPPRS